MNAEIPVVFDCAGEQLIGVIHRGNFEATTGVVIVAGGPQYRVGSHRQFVLMARQLAAGGFPIFRFDYRGAGDSFGAKRSFEEIDQDIRVAIDFFIDNIPTIKQVTLMGLCDAASAIMMYGQQNNRVAGMILMNPWIRAVHGSGRARLRHYYLPRIMQKSFWQKVILGEFAPIKSMGDFMISMRAAIPSKGLNAEKDGGDWFVGRMLFGLERFKHPILLLLSSQDLANREFLRLCKTDRRWKKTVQGPNFVRREIVGADHTLSVRKNLDLAASHCLEWLRKLNANDP